MPECTRRRMLHPSIAAGDGEKFKLIALANLANVDYEDKANNMFCGSWWATAEEHCSVDTHCTSGEQCGGLDHCFDTGCHVQDILQVELGDDWREIVDAAANGGSIGKLSDDDPKRNLYCGISWGQASTKCTTWCRGGDDDCPRGEKCFAETTCYYDDDLVPTMQPVVTLSPSRSPILRVRSFYTDILTLLTRASAEAHGDWRSKIVLLSIPYEDTNTSMQTHCREHKDCKDIGHTCHSFLPGCNLVDMEVVKVDPNDPNPPRPKDWRDNPYDPHNFRFCGKDWTDASDNCRLSRHCPDMRCDDPELMCFEHLSYAGAEYCNAYEMYRGLTREPTYVSLILTIYFFILFYNVSSLFNISKRPTAMPTSSSPSDEPSPSPSKHPSLSPTTAPPTKQPSKTPTDAPATSNPTKSPTDQPTKFDSRYDNSNMLSEMRSKVARFFLSNALSKHRTSVPTQVIHGLCATSFEELQQTYRVALPCSNMNPCNTGQLCFPNFDVAAFLSGTISPVSREPTSRPSHSPKTPYPTYWYTYTPTNMDEQTAVGQKLSSIEEENTPSQKPISTKEENNNIQHPSPQISNQKDTAPKHTQKPTSQKEDVHQPAAQVNTPTIEQQKEPKYYCGKNMEELEQSCGSALECNHSRHCPPGQGCMKYDNCEQESQQKPNSSSLWNYFPDLCPVGLVGLHSPEGDCLKYYDCKDGLLEASHRCELGFMFDNRRRKCIDQKFVSSNCESGIDLAANIGHHESDEGVGENNDISILESDNKQQLDDILEGATPENHSLEDICPVGLIGFYAKDDCSKFYECDNAILLAVHTCDEGNRFDTIQGKCVSQNLVGSNCESNKNENQPSGSGLGSDSISQSDSELEKPVEQTNNTQNELIEPGDGNNINSRPDSVPENEEDSQIVEEPPHNYSPGLCPVGFNGFHAKEDCTKYYECTDGYVGLVHTCTRSYKFDKVSGRCISEELVNSYCYGPALDKENEQKQKQKTDNDQITAAEARPSHSPIPVGRPTTAPDLVVEANEGGGSFVWSNTTTPTVPKNESETPHWANWVKEYEENGETASRRRYHRLWMLTLIPMFLVLHKL
ncbi:LOW QUALITY PROTEIN: hypothetical protein ACHAXR_011262 [Thalassiosira sp. AJA248-18]